MNNLDWKKAIIPHIIAIVAATILIIAYFNPVLSGKKLPQGDITQWKGMAEEVLSYEKETGEQSGWTNSMFGGMPTYQIRPPVGNSNLMKPLDKGLRGLLPKPAGTFLLCFLGYYLLLVVLGVSPWLSTLGAIGFTFSTYNFLIVEAGHNTKFNTMAYMAPVAAGVLLAYRGKILTGGAIFALAFALNVRANHPQITYYLFLTLLIYVVLEAVNAVKNQKLPTFAKASGVLLIGAILGLASNAAQLWTTYEYSKDTIRGESELAGEGKKSSGLDRDYALAWSYGKLETMTLLVPRFYGGGSQEPVGDPQLKHILRQSGAKDGKGPTYWGAQPFTGGTIYHGAIICFLFLLGSIVVRGPIKWWLVAATIMAVVLSWGKNFALVTDLFFYYFPMYNKFRVVSMILVVAQFTMPLLGVLGLHAIISKQVNKQQVLNALKISVGVLGGILLFWIILGSGFLDFEGPKDSRYPEEFLDLLIGERISMMRMDAIRSLVLILLAAGAIWALIQEKLSHVIAVAAISVLVLGDLWLVNTRYLNSKDFVHARKADELLKPSVANKAISQDKGLDYRVLNLGNPFNDARTSYHHKSVGGYHGAKLRRYQDMIEQHISPEIQQLTATLQSGGASNIPSLFANTNILNMLNTKYVIGNPGAPPLQNSSANGNAWFINDFKMVNNADGEIAALKGINPKRQAVIDKRFSKQVQGKSFSADSTASIKLVDYKPNYLKYTSNTGSEQLAIFSEIYYNKGWDAYIDGQKTPHLRANYILRGMVVPAGKHDIEFKFQPSSLKTGKSISFISSLALLIFALAGLGLGFKNAASASTTEEA